MEDVIVVGYITVKIYNWMFWHEILYFQREMYEEKI